MHRGMATGLACLTIGVMIVAPGCGGSSVETVEQSVQVSTPSASSSDDGGWITLFDGTSTKGWVISREDKGPVDPEDFFVQDGAIGCKGLGYHWFRYDAREFGDFILTLEFKIAKDGNSGVCLHTSREGAPPYTGYEVQILGDYGQPPNKNSCGAIYDVVSPMYNASKPAGEWNQLEVTSRGPLVVVVLNGLKVIDTDFSKLTSPIGKFSTPYAQLSRHGYLTIQDHWKPAAWYRNIRIKPLD